MNADFDDNECLFRAVLPIEVFWKDGRPSSAAFKDKNGLSVDRDGGRNTSEAIECVKNNLQGNIVSLLVLQCKDINAYVTYVPIKDNPFHSEIHGNIEKRKLSDSQAKKLAKCCKIEYCYK